jgi:S-ribosylhomocysteine lyase
MKGADDTFAYRQLGWRPGTIGDLDHRRLKVPSVKLRGAHHGANGDFLYCVDLRWRRPNAGEYLTTTETHSLEHFMLDGFSRRLPHNFIGVGIMGCLTGFYLTLLGEGRRQVIEETLESVLNDVLAASEVPYARMDQCGDWQNHDLAGAQAIAREVLARRSQWQNVV